MAKFFALILVFIVFSLHADEPLVDFLADRSVVLQWDSYLQTGIMWLNGNSFSFSVDSPYALLNFSSVRQIEAISYRDHRLFLPENTKKILEEFFPEVAIQRSPGKFTTVSAIFIDPGHGGKDPGAVGQFVRDGVKYNIFEKDIVLNIGLTLKRLLEERYPEMEIIISRDDDTYVSLEQRTEMANSISLGQHESILFVSLHVNASLNREARGFEVWYLPPHVERKNVVTNTISEDPDVQTILHSMRDEELTIESALLAQSILKNLDFQIGMQSLNRGIRQESWYVVHNANMPAVLVEVGFITNSYEVKLLNNRAYLQQTSQALANGIKDFISAIERNDN